MLLLLCAIPCHGRLRYLGAQLNGPAASLDSVLAMYKFQMSCSQSAVERPRDLRDQVQTL